MKRALSITLLLVTAACKTEEFEQPASSGGEATGPRVAAVTHCPAPADGLDHVEADTNGDEKPDVVRAFRVIGEGPTQRRQLLCREVDLDGDGRHDVARFYSEEGRPLREISDRNFDGVLDAFEYFEDGRIIRIEEDTNGDGRIDSKTIYARGVVVRVERDTLGRSTDANWLPNRWEYIEDGNVVRIGDDQNGDGRVDTWDRDELRVEQQRREEYERANAEAEDADAADSEDGD